MNGLIEIRATDQGDLIKVNGAYTDRLQHGAFVALSLLNMFVNKIAASDGAGYSSADPVKTILVPTTTKKKRGLPAGFLETTEMGDLEPPPPRRRRR